MIAMRYSRAKCHDNDNYFWMMLEVPVVFWVFLPFHRLKLNFEVSLTNEHTKDWDVLGSFQGLGQVLSLLFSKNID